MNGSAGSNPGEPLLLAIDNGTQSVRALAVTLDGEFAAVEKVPVDPYFSERPGWAEQHVDVYWDAVCRACRALLENDRVDVSRLAGMAVTTQRSTVVSLGDDGAALRPAIVWLDQRRCSAPPPLPRWLEAGAKLTGRAELLRELRAEAECNWIAENQPEIAAKTSKLLFLSGYLNWRLTGEFIDSAAAQVGYVPFDFKQRDWASPGDPRWRALSVNRAQLPELKAPGELLGTLTPEAAAATGLPAGLAVIAAGTDKACELLGSGCLDPATGGISYGTTATINTVNERYVEPIPPMPAYPSAVPHAWCSEVMVRRGFWMVEWFKRELGGDLLGNAAFDTQEQGEAAFAQLERLLADTPPGADGLLLQPYWSSGTPFPGGEARGAVIGFGDMHGRSHMYRAIVEGIAHALCDAGGRLARRNKVPLQRLRVAGGGARSDAVMQITADIFGLPAERPHVTEASGLGAAINVAVALGLHPNYETAVARMTRVGATFTPDPANHRLYAQIHERVYSGMYERLAPLYRAIREITGYPP